MRLFIAATLAASMFTTSLFAAETAAPLPAGKPAGVTKAQDAADNSLWWVLGGLAVVGVVAAVASNGGKGPQGQLAPSSTA